jgi:hypothetical protein
MKEKVYQDFENQLLFQNEIDKQIKGAHVTHT